MNVLAFIASIVGSVAWPVAVAAIAFSQRTALTGMIGRIRSAKAFGAELGIADQIEAVRERIDAVPMARVPTPEERAGRGPCVAVRRVITDTSDPSRHGDARGMWEELGDELADTSAIGSIVATWIELENGLMVMAAIYGLTDVNPSLNAVLGYLEKHDVLSEAMTVVIRSLRDIRNRAVHSGANGVTLSDAQHFRDTSRRILERIGAADELGLSPALRSSG